MTGGTVGKGNPLGYSNNGSMMPSPFFSIRPEALESLRNQAILRQMKNSQAVERAGGRAFVRSTQHPQSTLESCLEGFVETNVTDPAPASGAGESNSLLVQNRRPIEPPGLVRGITVGKLACAVNIGQRSRLNPVYKIR